MLATEELRAHLSFTEAARNLDDTTSLHMLETLCANCSMASAVYGDTSASASRQTHMRVRIIEKDAGVEAHELQEIRN